MATGLSLAGVAGILPEADAIGAFSGPPGWIAAGVLTLGTAAVVTAPEWAPTAGKILSQTGHDLYKAGHWFASTLENALGGTSHAAESEQSKKQGEAEPAKESSEIKRVSPDVIRQMKKAGINPHDLKPKKNASKYDLFQDKNGNIVTKLKDGSGEADPTGYNVKEFLP
ncbi:MAG: polymorphic toxin type 33 domain-containing protein [Firmicutes bacterium]|nr:polymorphic toxin type 33 domain-containing protein [Bacillota bacterium]